MLLPYFPHEPRGKTPFSENIVHNAECEIVREIGGAFNTEMPDEHYRLWEVFENIIDRRFRSCLYYWNIWKRDLCGFPSVKHLFKLRDQGFCLKIAGHCKHYVIGMVIRCMKGFKIIHSDTFYSLNLRVPAERVVGTIEPCGEVTPRELDRIIIPSTDAFNRLLLAQFQFFLTKSGVSEDIRKDF